MFPSGHTPRLAQRALGALRVARSFLLLEDDYDVDWEVGQDEPTRVPHPHRAPLRRGIAQRRAGHAPPRPQACLSPVSPVGSAAGAPHEARQRRAEAAVESRRDGSRVALDSGSFSPSA